MILNYSVFSMKCLWRNAVRNQMLRQTFKMYFITVSNLITYTIYSITITHMWSERPVSYFSCSTGTMKIHRFGAEEENQSIYLVHKLIHCCNFEWGCLLQGHLQHIQKKTILTFISVAFFKVFILNHSQFFTGHEKKCLLWYYIF